jgi:methyl-accepting chemotaxis protein
MKLKNLLYNSWFLYFVVFVVFFNIVGHALNNNYMIIIFFILISFITSFFSKNMIVILVLGISFANILFYGPKQMNVEGYENKNSKNDKSKKGVATFNPDDLDEKENFNINDFDLSNLDLNKLSSDSSDNQDKLKDKMEEIKQVKDRIQNMKKNLPKDANNAKLKDEEVDFLNEKFTDFLKIQEDVLSNIGSLEKSIQKVDTIVKDIRSNMDKIPK